jgi:hypothetical protein
MRNGRRGFYVTSVEAADNLWQRSNSMRDIAKAQAVRIRRIDAEIPRAAAEDIRQVWLRMLRDRRPMKKSRIEFELAGYLRFAIQQPHGEALEAELWLPALGPKTRSLVKYLKLCGSTARRLLRIGARSRARLITKRIGYWRN